MKRILGLDLGTNSIGWAIRDTDSSDSQIVHKGVLTFEKGVGEEKGNEIPLVQQRTLSRSKRRNYQARKYRKWELLETLILHKPKLCPLTLEDLNKWRKYVKGQDRVYPKSKSFMNWLRLDFDGDGNVDFQNPYELRMIAAKERFDNPLIAGRVFYHMVQRRGFRGRDEDESKTILDGSENRGIIGANKIHEIMERENTLLGGALHLARTKYNERIRNRYGLRTDVEAELRTICKVQGIDEKSGLFRDLYKSVIWQRPLRTQKGNVGRCTFEPSKPRSPLSHPLYEEYRARTFINNIRIRRKGEPQSKDTPLSDEQKLSVYQYVFFGKKRNREHFDFLEIMKMLDKNSDTYKFNFDPQTTVSGSPVTFSLRELFGSELDTIRVPHQPNTKRGDEKDYYDYNDLWHILFTFDSRERLEAFAKEKLNLDEKKAKAFSMIVIPKGYASLSLNAINKILPFLRKGFIYSEAVYLANLTKVLGKNLLDNEIEDTLRGIRCEMESRTQTREEISIINDLISDQLNLPIGQQHGRYPTYTLSENDRKEVEEKIIEHLGSKTWIELEYETKLQIKQHVERGYEEFLQAPRAVDSKLLYRKVPRLDELIKDYLKQNWNVDETNLRYLYHPSETDIYAPAKEIDGKKYLSSPVPIGRGFKNPMAMKTLHQLRHLINYLIEQGTVNEETKVVVEIARELNDANRRKAIENHQRDREKENQGFVERIEEFAREQNVAIDITGEMIGKYRLWEEQGRQCLYTGRIINLTNLLDGASFDLEHTIPADVSFDNELKNLTIADSVYNRQIKEKRIPTELPNYENDVEIGGILYSAIQPRLKFMEEKVKRFKEQVEFWRKETKRATTKERKDHCIQKRHYNQFELDYWSKKYETFTIKEWKPRWRNSQLRDTQVMTKYALHYLRTVFERVEVEKGTVVSEFRKIFRLDKKERTNHTHHVTDAAILTLIPSPSTRDKLLEEHFAAMENYTSFHAVPRDWNDFDPALINNIEKDTLVNHITQDRTLVPARKFVRKKGRIQYVKEKLPSGKWQYRVDEGEKKIPLVSQGDSIRGRLHKDSFYGAIRKDPNSDDIRYVERRLIRDFESENDLKDIVDEAVKKAISEIVAARIRNGKSFKEAIAEPIWMVDKIGNPRKTDKNGNSLLPIRHVRCYAKAGNGVLKKAIPLKGHIFKSKHEYKRSYYVQNETNSLLLLYESANKGNVKRAYRIVNILELAKSNLKNTNELYENPEYNTKEIGKDKNKMQCQMKLILKVGSRVIPWQINSDEVKHLDRVELLKRLYMIYKFNEPSPSTAYIYLKFHTEARPDGEIKDKCDKVFNPNKYQPVLALTPNKFNCLVEGVDFDIALDGEIRIKR